MNDATTFFRDRQKDAGETYQLTLEGWRGTHHVSVYSQRPIPSQTLQDKNVATQQDYETAVKDLRKAMTSGGGGGGGLIVIASDEKRSRTFSVVRVNAKSAARGFFALSPGRPAAFVGVDGNSSDYKCAEGSHALVPVSEEAQERLQDFVGYLSWLSPDIESLVLNAIRRPSLDRRLDRVETRLFAQTTDEEMGGPQQGMVGRIKSWLARSVPTPLIRVATAVLLAALLAMNGYVLYRLYPRGDYVVEYTARGKSKGQVVEPYVQDAKALLEVLHKSKKPLLHKVDDAHFASLRTEEEIQKAFAKPTALWGLVKLQILAIVPSPQDEDFLGKADAVTDTKNVYAAIPEDKIPADAREFLAAVGCRMHNDPPVPFASKPCKEVAAGAFEAGLQELTKFAGRP